MIMKNILSIILYVLAVLLAIFTVWSFINCTEIITEAIDAGQISYSGNMFEIISFYMANCAQNLVNTVLLVSVGLILQKKPYTSNNAILPAYPQETTENDDELEDWFEEADMTEEADMAEVGDMAEEVDMAEVADLAEVESESTSVDLKN